MNDVQPTAKSVADSEKLTLSEVVDSRGRNVYRFDELARNNSQVIVVVLSDAEYELRKTKAGRLVLNK